MTSITIRSFEARDIPVILQIQSSSREAAQWAESAYRNLGRAGEKAWLAECNGSIAGFLIARLIAEEMEILNLAVDGNLRRQGTGSALLCAALLWGVQNGSSRAFLEVRPSNRQARKFYEAQGFASAGVRPNYYRDPIEDALILVRVLDAADWITSQPLST